MKLKVKRKELMKCLDVLAVSIPKKTTVQIMSNFLFVVEDNMCNIYAYNGELQIQGQVAVESSENFKLCIPANRLMNTARLMTDEDLTLKYDDEKFVLNLVAGKKRYKLTGENPVHFPVQTLAEEGNMRLKVPSNQIIKHIKTLSTIVDWTEMRPMMAGVTMFVNHGKIEITGVHNAAYFYRGVTDIAHDEHFEVVLHKDIAMALGNAKEIGDTDILISERSIRVKVDGFTFTSVLINVKSILLIEKYFDYERDKYLVVDKNEILGSIRRLLNYANEFSTLVMDVSKGEMNLSLRMLLSVLMEKKS